MLLIYLAGAAGQVSQPGLEDRPPLFNVPVPVVPTPGFLPGIGFGLTPVEVWWWLDPFWNWYYPWFNGAFWWNGIPVPLAVPHPLPFAVPMPMPGTLGRPELPRPEAAPAEAKPSTRPQAPKDDLEARAKMEAELRAGTAEFSLGDFARALKRFEAAHLHLPLDPLPLFHQGQAHLALGNYQRAVVVIQRGLRWNPDWAKSEFRPRALYGPRAAAFDRHLGQLAELVEKTPNDPGLLFLLGYQLWFDGKQEQARPLLRRAAALSIDNDHLTGFLKK
jgi:Flp pilus assembly protein TadD